MKKLLIFHPYLAPYRIDLYNQLSKCYEVKALLTGSKKEKDTLAFDIEKVNQNANFDYTYQEKGLYIGRHLISTVYIRTIRKFAPDIIFTHELGFNTLLSIFLKNWFQFSIYTTIDDSLPMITSRGFFKSKLQEFVFKKVDKILVINPDVQKYLEEKNPKLVHKTFFLPLIQNENLLTDKLKLAEKKAVEIRNDLRLNYSSINKVLLFVGRLEQVKRPDVLLESFIELNRNDTLLVFVGKGTLERSLKLTITQNNIEDKVIFTGKLSGEDLYAWYNVADVFVLPSVFEPFGAVVNEALVAGLHTIVTENVGANCLIDENNGNIIPANKKKALTGALASFLSKVNEKKKVNKMNISFQEVFHRLSQIIENEN